MKEPWEDPSGWNANHESDASTGAFSSCTPFDYATADGGVEFAEDTSLQLAFILGCEWQSWFLAGETVASGEIEFYRGPVRAANATRCQQVAERKWGLRTHLSASGDGYWYMLYIAGDESSLLEAVEPPQ